MNKTAEGVGDGEDPILREFLEFLALDMHLHPERVQAPNPAFANRVQALVGDVRVDLHRPLVPEDD